MMFSAYFTKIQIKKSGFRLDVATCLFKTNDRKIIEFMFENIDKWLFTVSKIFGYICSSGNIDTV